MVESGLTSSKGEARRMIRQNAVRVNENKVTDETMDLTTTETYLLQVGKRRFIKVSFK